MCSRESAETRCRRYRWVVYGVWAALIAVAATAQQGASLELRPSSVPPDASITAVGRGFCAEPDCSTVTLRLQGVIVADEIAVDDKGGFEVTFVADAGPGEYLASATQGVASGEPRTTEPVGREARARLEIETGPRLVVDPAPVRSGDRVTIWGVDLSEGSEDSLTVYLDGQVVELEVERREDGLLELQVPLLVEPGLHELAVTHTGADGEALTITTEIVVGVGEGTPGPHEPPIE